MRTALRLPVLACALGALLVAGCKGKKDAPKDAPRPPLALPPASAEAKVLADVPAGAKPEAKAPRPAAATAGSAAPHPLPSTDYVFHFAERGGGAAWSAGIGDKIQVVHNGRAVGLHDGVHALTLSPDGQRIAYRAYETNRWRMFVDHRDAGDTTAEGRPVFSPDGAHVMFEAPAGEGFALVIDGRPRGQAKAPYLAFDFGAGGDRVIFLQGGETEGMGRLVVSDLALERPVVVAPAAGSLVLNGDRSRFAAITVAGKALRVATASVARPDEVRLGEEYESISALGFAPDGISLGYVAERRGERFVVRDGERARLPELDQVAEVAAGPVGIGVLAVVAEKVQLLPFFLEGAAPGKAYDAAEGLTWSADGRAHAYAAMRGEAWFIVVNGVEGPPFDRVVTPSFSPDGKVVYRARKDGKRFVVVAGADGKTLRQHPAYEQVFPTRFTAGGAVAYGVKDGSALAWKVEPL